MSGVCDEWCVMSGVCDEWCEMSSVRWSGV